MKKFAVYIPYCENDKRHLNICLNHLNQYNLEVYLCKTIPTNDYLYKAIEGELKETEFKHEFSNLEIKHFEYRYLSFNNEFNYLENSFNFSNVKNVAFDIIKKDWILFVDSDDLLILDPDFIEWFDNEQNEKLSKIGAFNVNVNSYIQEGEKSGYLQNRQERLIRNNENIRYENRIHESVTNSLKANNYLILDSPNYLLHRGYNDKKNLVSKLPRNLGLLASQLLNQLYDRYFIDKMLLQIETNCNYQKLAIKTNTSPTINESLNCISKLGIGIDFDLKDFVNEIIDMLQNVQKHNYDYNLLQKLYSYLEYLIILKVV